MRESRVDQPATVVLLGRRFHPRMRQDHARSSHVRCLDQPAPDPAQFGFPTEDDGSRDDLLLGGNLAMPPVQPDAEALRGSSVRIVPAIGEEGEGSLARRGGEALAALLGVTPVVFPGNPCPLEALRFAEPGGALLPGERFPIGVSAAVRSAGTRCCRQTT